MSEHDDTKTLASDELGLSRRGFLRYVGTGAAAVLGAGQLGTLTGCAAGPDGTATVAGGWVGQDGTPTWKPPGYPLPLPGDPQPVAEDRNRLASYTVSDGLVLPEGFDYRVMARWGDQFGPAADPQKRITYGYNNDFTALVEIPNSEDYWLFVNHEYVSYRPWQAAALEDGVDLPYFSLHVDPERPELTRGVVSVYPQRDASPGWELPRGHYVNLADDEQSALIPPEIRAAMARVSEAGMSAQGISVLRVRRTADGGFQIVEEAEDHRRITAIGAENIAPGAEGALPFAFTGPAAYLLGRPRGTFCNCSGGFTPWGTFLTCEENIQYQVNEEVSPAGQPRERRRMRFGGQPTRINGKVVQPTPEPAQINGMGYALDASSGGPIDGREYGWVAEVDPATGEMRKHTALGRFRHENVAIRAEAGKPLAAYMGDDRRGGHVWKFVSSEPVTDPEDPNNSRLFEEGTLYVARFEASANGEGGTGSWIPLEPGTPLRRPEPEHCAASHMQMPDRADGGDGGYVEIGPEGDLDVESWQEQVAAFADTPFDQCTLGDLVRPSAGDADGEVAEEDRQRGILVMDAFVMGNAVGGTPTARPEDLEVHPADQSVYIAFTDATDSSDGSPDMRIFPDSHRKNSRQYGAVFRVVEDANDPAATSFSWGKFVASGEIAELGGGFANADNLVFDPEGNLWMVTDISTSALNFETTREEGDGTRPGEKQFRGVFGNNAMFMIPTRGPQAGVPHLFAIGPTECEICGPTFSEDGRSLILSIQHPGELNGVRSSEAPDETRDQVLSDRQGELFTQQRKVPLGSNFPSSELDKAPRPCIVCITRQEA
ncbi:MAG: alkaline phosphatase PhoX [Acidobacteriota bacterium]